MDGGVLNNLPSTTWPRSPRGRSWRRRDPPHGVLRAGEPALPTIAETLARATVLGSVERAERNRALALLLVTPDVEADQAPHWSALDEAVEAGRVAALERARGRRRRQASRRARRRVRAAARPGAPGTHRAASSRRAMPVAQPLRLADEELDAHVEAPRALLVLPDAGDRAVDEHDRRDPAGGAVDAVVDARRQERLARPVVERVDVEDGQQVDRLRPVERA